MSVALLTVTPRRPAEDVFRVLTHLENAPKWSRAIDEQLITPGPMRVGSQRRAVNPMFAGRRSENVVELMEYEENRRLAMRGVSGFAFPVTIAIDLREQGGATTINWSTDMRPTGLLRPFGGLLASVYRASFRKDLARLKTMMEAGQL